MEMESKPTTRQISREELYARVWQTPLTRLAAEFGITGTGLAKICRRMHVPYPPQGYWARKQAGKSVAVEALPVRPAGVPAEVAISPAPSLPGPPAEVQAVIVAAETSARTIAIPNTLEELHPKVRAWLALHKKEQENRERENKKRRRDDWGFAKPPLRDLTERDLYRFRVTSAIFKAVENAGGRVASAILNGKIAFLVSDEKVECSIVEKMMQSFLAPKAEASNWTAYPEYHQSGLTSSGFLRVTIATYLPHGPTQWIETAKKKMADLLPEIVGRIMAAGPIIIEQKREREEWTRRRKEEEDRRYERQRQRQIEEHRWGQFCATAAQWEEHRKLLNLLAEVKSRFTPDSDATIAGRQVSEWIAWAERRIDAHNPFRSGLGGLFENFGVV